MSYTSTVRAADRGGVERHAAPQAIAALIREVSEAEAEAATERGWLEVLYLKRMSQIESGDWPVVEGDQP